MSYKPHYNCRACGYGPSLNAAYTKAGEQVRLKSVLDLGIMPLPNAFKKAGERRPGHYPVELLVCPRCYLGQLSAVVDPRVMYADYPYVTSPSDTMREHFDKIWDALSAKRKLDAVVEIGSNDGLCLQHFKNRGTARVMGIDPAENLVKIARDRDIDTICSLFDARAAGEAYAKMPPIDLVLARHVFCHVDNWDEFINSVAIMCSKDTLVCIEVPYAQNTIEQQEWDQVYAEHLSYLTVRSMTYLLEPTALRLHSVSRYPIHGGAISMILHRRDSELPVDPSVAEFLEAERCNPEDWENFGHKARAQIDQLRTLVRGLRAKGKRVVGYGASAKSTVWINACGFTQSDIEGVYDYTPQKLYTNIPGTNIPVLHEGGFYASAADYAVVWCWNFLPEIVSRQALWIAGGGRFIVPVPEVRIL